MTKQATKLSVTALEKIDEHCLKFEEEWQQGNTPPIKPFLNSFQGTPAERAALLGELIALDADYRQKRGESLNKNAYLQDFPRDQTVIEDALHAANKTEGQRFNVPTMESVGNLFPALDNIQLVGTGGMGAVYKARQRGLDRTVALKLLPDEISSNAKFALRFAREARALARLNHPHIVSIYEFGQQQDTYFLMMEFVDGPSLREVILSDKLLPKQALEIVTELCDALQYAHDHGVVHRDIKPENILIDRSGKVKVADFGLSRLATENNADLTLTATNQVFGTWRYMAPEQMEGAHQVDHRADLYSLGVVIYEMLTGELPVGRFSPPSHKVTVDVRLDEVVLKTLEKEPDRRYQQASDIKSDIVSLETNAARPEDIARSPLECGVTQAVLDTHSSNLSRSDDNLGSQELSARLLLARRQLMEKVEQALRPLFWGQIIQMLLGIVCIAIGVYGWTRDTQVPQQLISGIVIHIYGVGLILSAGVTCSKIRRMDSSQPTADVKQSLTEIRRHYLVSGAVIGLAWWFLWIPFCIALGATPLMQPTTLWICLAIGVCGFIPSLFLYGKLLKSKSPWARARVRELVGESLTIATQRLEEIEKAQVH